eukprot:TRINITY_DN18754_c0_g2_i2.p2 TRINITY_DN18754_c0_g2~~TRINITY_DN18754_c0_g2_i2.p2  ORF type:complete len:163 (+),score=20.67 TRINITY_DN18754_c0_g2_i2:49-537(+)
MRFLTSLGTGNDLARSLGWGGSFDKRWTKEFSAMYKTLRRVAEAEALTMDCWQVSLARSNDEKEEWFQELPHAFEAKENEPGVQVGYSWNYVSVGKAVMKYLLLLQYRVINRMVPGRISQKQIIAFITFCLLQQQYLYREYVYEQNRGCLHSVINITVKQLQ